MSSTLLLDIKKDGDKIVLCISGSGFLYNMVRIIAGTLIRVGTGAFPPEAVSEILAARDRRLAGPTAPAKGLTLVGMEYEKELPSWHHRENEMWSYSILQSHIKKEGTAYFMVVRCEDDEWERLLLRNIHHGFQNGAQQVFVVDLDKKRLKDGEKIGYYRIQRPEQKRLLEAMGLLDEEERKLVGEICRGAEGEPEKKAEWYCARDAAAVDNG